MGVYLEMADVDVQAIAAIAWRCIRECKDYEGPPVMCPAHQEEAKSVARRCAKMSNRRGLAVILSDMATELEKELTGVIAEDLLERGYSEGAREELGLRIKACRAGSALMDRCNQLALKWEGEAANYEQRKDDDFTAHAMMLRYCAAQLESAVGSVESRP